jgi:hypothetical protein
MATQLGPRKLTTHQKTVLIQVLLVFPEQRVRIVYSPSASDGLFYAQEFLAIFKAIGWDVAEIESGEFPSAQSTGLAIVAREAESLPPAAEALRDALRIYTIDATIHFDPACNIPPGSFVLAIGS